MFTAEQNLYRGGRHILVSTTLSWLWISSLPHKGLSWAPSTFIIRILVFRHGFWPSFVYTYVYVSASIVYWPGKRARLVRKQAKYTGIGKSFSAMVKVSAIQESFQRCLAFSQVKESSN